MWRGARVDVAKVAAKVANAAAKVVKVAKVVKLAEELQEVLHRRGIASLDSSTSSRAIEGGHQPRSLEAPAPSPASSAGGARGCGVEFEVPDGFRLSASDVRSARAKRERPAEPRAQVCDRVRGKWGDACRARAGADLPPVRRA